jgi:microcystin-dependent protein
MSDPFLGEIKMVSFNLTPKGWALCNGQLLPISQNSALFSLLGTTYGGNGTTTFGLPDMRARAPMHVGGGALR